MKKIIRIGMAQINTTVGDIQGNKEKIFSLIGQAKKAGVSILTFPEMTLTGYPPEDLLFKDEFINQNKNALNEIVSKTDSIIVICGFVDSHNSFLYNAAAVIANKSISGIYKKILLPNYGVFDEKRYFKPGNSHLIFSCNGILFAVNICEDIWLLDGPGKVQTRKGGAKLLFNISSSPYHSEKAIQREEMLKKRAATYCSYIAYNNLVGGQDGLVFDGGSMVINPKGEIVLKAPQFKENLIITDIPHAALTGNPYSLAKDNIKYIPIDYPFELSCMGNPHSNKPVVRLTKTEEIYLALVTGTRDYIKKNRFSKVVIGVSGGIDSALTAAIAVDALSSDNVIVVSMPSPYSSPGSIDDAGLLAENLGVRLINIPITSIFQAYTDSLTELFAKREDDTTEENLQARIRGNLLMALSNKFDWLLLTTGNKSEISVGYCTLYGDMAGGFAVLKDVPKTMVYKLCEYKNNTSQKGIIIPLSTIKKPPSAELRPDQKDEDSLPPYFLLDRLLNLYIEENKTISEIESEGFLLPLINKISTMVDKSEYKRRQGPVGIKITPKAFGKDWRFPITNLFSEGKK